MNVPLSGLYRELFCEEYRHLGGEMDRKPSVTAVLNELSRFFVIKRAKVTEKDSKDYPGVIWRADKYHIIGEK